MSDFKTSGVLSSAQHDRVLLAHFHKLAKITRITWLAIYGLFLLGSVVLVLLGQAGWYLPAIFLGLLLWEILTGPKRYLLPYLSSPHLRDEAPDQQFTTWFSGEGLHWQNEEEENHCVWARLHGVAEEDGVVYFVTNTCKVIPVFAAQLEGKADELRAFLGTVRPYRPARLTLK